MLALSAAGFHPEMKGRDHGLVSARGDAQEVDEGNLVFIRLAQPTVVGRVRVGSHERVVDDLLAPVDLPMRFPLIVVPDLAAAFRHDGLDRQQESHLFRFEDATLRIDEGDARAVELETRLQQRRGQLVVDLGQPSEMFECCKTHPGVVGKKIGGDSHRRPIWWPC